MKIIVHEENAIGAARFIDFLEENYRDKIFKILKGGRLIKLINEDEIKIVTKNYDGLRADVAIGKAARHLTVGSKEEKPIWTASDLENYLNHIEVSKSEDRNLMKIKVSVDTTEIDEALKKLKEFESVLENIIKLQQKSFSSPMPDFNNVAEWLKHNPNVKIGINPKPKSDKPGFIKVNQHSYDKSPRNEVSIK